MHELLINISIIHTTDLGLIRIKNNLKLSKTDVIDYCKNLIADKKVLERDLKGYIDYKKKVKYRLIPFIW